MPMVWARLAQWQPEVVTQMPTNNAMHPSRGVERFYNENLSPRLGDRGRSAS